MIRQIGQQIIFMNTNDYNEMNTSKTIIYYVVMNILKKTVQNCSKNKI